MNNDANTENANTEGTKSFLPLHQALEQELRSPLEQIEAALRGLRFGSINVVVQDGVVVQVDRTEKLRLRSASRT
jgi:hypothetical protein